MNPREQALKSQLRKAQALIAQFEDGTGRHNSNLLGTERDAGGRINLDTSAFDEAHRRYLRTIARQTYSYATAYAMSRGFIDPDLETWVEERVKPQDELETFLCERGLLRAKPKDCDVGQIVRLEEIDCPDRWARARGPQEQEICDESGFVREVVINVFEFERTRYYRRIGPRPRNPTEPENIIERAFWKRIA